LIFFCSKTDVNVKLKLQNTKLTHTQILYEFQINKNEESALPRHIVGPDYIRFVVMRRWPKAGYGRWPEWAAATGKLPGVYHYAANSHIK
jgi:hypothetical protein